MSIAKQQLNSAADKSGLCQQTSDVSLLICQAEMTRTSTRKYARALAERLGLDPDNAVLMGPIKTASRIFEKAASRYEGRIDRIVDISREKLLVETLDDIRDIQGLLKAGGNSAHAREWASKGIEVADFEDMFAVPNKRGFRAINVILAVDLGKGRKHLCELQITHRGMEENFYPTSHDSYEQLREIEETAKAEGREMTSEETETAHYLRNHIIETHAAGTVLYGLQALEAPQQPQKMRHRPEHRAQELIAA